MERIDGKKEARVRRKEEKVVNKKLTTKNIVGKEKPILN